MSRYRYDAAPRLLATRLAVIYCWLLISACGSSTPPTPESGCSSKDDCNAGDQCDLASHACEPAGTSAGASDEAQDVSAQTQCTVEPQAGCPQGSVCLVATSSGETSCYGTGTVPHAGPCATVDDCQPSLLCVYGQCQSICKTASDCAAAPYATCTAFPARDNAAAVTGTRFCSLQCNPADPANTLGNTDFSPCLPDATCGPQGTEGPIGATDCYLAGAARSGAACAKPADCGPGLVCLTAAQAATNGICTPYCLMGRTRCSTGTCLSFGAEQQVGTKASLVELGYCG
jgi:hypothetical protein